MTATPPFFTAVAGAELDQHPRTIAAGVCLSGGAAEAVAFDYLEARLRAWAARWSGT